MYFKKKSDNLKNMILNKDNLHKNWVVFLITTFNNFIEQISVLSFLGADNIYKYMFMFVVIKAARVNRAKKVKIEIKR